jgi:hydroxylaminobenzene mutase
LIVAGAILFLLGLLQGAVVQMLLNSRMALSAHLTAVQGGTALMVVGVVWPAVSLSETLQSTARWAIILGLYALWVGLTLSATTGASDALPIAGAGYKAGRVVEMTSGWPLFVAGLIHNRWAGVTSEQRFLPR